MMEMQPGSLKASDIEFLIATAIEAGSVILAIYEKSAFAVRQKADLSPFTEADVAAEALILERLHTRFPHIPVIAEEALSKGRAPEPGDMFFLVDL